MRSESARTLGTTGFLVCCSSLLHLVAPLEILSRSEAEQFDG